MTTSPKAVRFDDDNLWVSLTCLTGICINPYDLFYYTIDSCIRPYSKHQYTFYRNKTGWLETYW